VDTSEVIRKIVSASGKSEGEVAQLVSEKKQRFEGLLTESGAAMVVAKELGVELGMEEQALERLQIAQLKEGMQNVELLVRAKHIFSPREFEKNGKTGRLCNLIVADASGEIRLTVWNKCVQLLEEEKVERGSALLVKNCRVDKYGGNLQLNLPYNGSVVVKPNGENHGLPPINEKKAALKEISGGENDISVVGRVVRIFPEKSFERETGSGKLINFLFGDGTAIVRATAWDSMVEGIKKLVPGEAVKIEGAYTKEGPNGVELQLGKWARILKNPKSGSNLPSIEEMQGLELHTKNIGELQENDRLVALNGEIAAILPGKLVFNVCPKCGKKAEAAGENYSCGNCKEVQPETRAVISLRLKDKSGEINAVLFGNLAEKAIGLDSEELKKKLEDCSPEQLIAELNGKLAGKQIKMSGLVKKNSYSNEVELVAKTIELGG
jgi:replication factor A1